MTKLITFALVTASLWILQKSGTECVHLLPAKDETRTSHRCQYDQHKDVSILSDILNPWLGNHPEKTSVTNHESQSSVLENFVSCFTECILSSERLTVMYDTSIPPQKAEETYYRIFLNAETNVHTKDARRITRIVSSAIAATFRNLTVPQHVQSYGYSVGKIMLSANILNHNNLKDLCHSYIKYNELESKFIPKIPDKSDVRIQAISNSLVHITSALGIYTPQTVEPISRDFADFLYDATGVPRVPPKNPCDDINVVDIFAAKFTRIISTSPKLVEIYDTSHTPELAEEMYRRVVFDAVRKARTCDPSGVARICSDAVRDTFGSLNATQHVQVHGYMAAKFLKSMNVLTCRNVHELVGSFVGHVKIAVKNVPSTPDRRYAFIQAVSDGCVGFIDSLGLFTPVGVVLLAQEFANALYFVAGIPNTHSYDPPSSPRM